MRHSTRLHALIRQFCLSLVLGLSATAALAQNSAPAPVTDPRNALPSSVAPAATLPAPSIEPALPSPEQEVQRRLAQKIVPTKFRIAGVKALPFQPIAELFAPLANQPTALSVLVEKANQVTKMYQEAGYVLSYAVIPNQKFEGGVVEVTVVEGYIDNVVIQGNPGGAEPKIRAIAEQLKAYKPLTREAFDRVSGVLARLSNLGASINAQPPTVVGGGTTLTVTVNRRAITGGVSTETRDDGLRAIVTAGLNGVTSLGENLSLTTLIPIDATSDRYYAGSLSIPVGNDGWRIGAFGNSFDSRPVSNTLSAIGYDAKYVSQSERAGGSVSYPLVLQQNESLDLSLSAYGTKLQEIYTATASRQRLPIGTLTRVLSIEGNYAQTVGTGLQRISLGLFQGFDKFGADRVNSTAELDFFKTRLGASQTFQFTPIIGAVLSGQGQFSSNELTTAERIQFGGRSFGQGYRPGDFSGDKGYGVAAELNASLPLDFDYIKSFQPYLSVDGARVYANTQKLARDQASSVALGLRISDRKYYTVDLNVALPTGDLPSDMKDRSPRFNANYSLGF